MKVTHGGFMATLLASVGLLLLLILAAACGGEPPATTQPPPVTSAAVSPSPAPASGVATPVFASGPCAAATPVVGTGFVIDLQGASFACEGRRNCTVPATCGAPVAVNGEARTEAGGELLLLSTTTVFSLKENSTLNFITVTNALQYAVLKAGRLVVGHDADGRDVVVVEAGTVKVEALDTLFSVEAGGALVKVSVSSGAVRITMPGQSVTSLGAGFSQTILRAGGPRPQEPLDEAETAGFRGEEGTWPVRFDELVPARTDVPTQEPSATPTASTGPAGALTSCLNAAQIAGGMAVAAFQGEASICQGAECKAAVCNSVAGVGSSISTGPAADLILATRGTLFSLKQNSAFNLWKGEEQPTSVEFVRGHMFVAFNSGQQPLAINFTAGKEVTLVSTPAVFSLERTAGAGVDVYVRTGVVRAILADGGELSLGPGSLQRFDANGRTQEGSADPALVRAFEEEMESWPPGYAP